MIDNYDSFTYNLVQELAEISGAPIEVVRNDIVLADELLERSPQAIVVSPGPGVPNDAGVSMEMVHRAVDTPVLGICLGLQTLAPPVITRWWSIVRRCRTSSRSPRGPTKVW